MVKRFWRQFYFKVLGATISPIKSFCLTPSHLPDTISSTAYFIHSSRVLHVSYNQLWGAVESGRSDEVGELLDDGANPNFVHYFLVRLLCMFRALTQVALIEKNKRFR